MSAMTDNDKHGSESPTAPPERDPDDKPNDDEGPLLNPHMAIVLAIVPGLFGFLGLGQMYKRSWGWGVFIFFLGLLFSFGWGLGSLQSDGPGALWLAVPVVSWPLLLPQLSAGSFMAAAVTAKLAPYAVVWGWSVYSAWTGWESTKGEM